MTNSIKSIANRTLEIELESIKGLSNFIDQSFEDAVNAIHQSKGRFIVSGIGKSAIIAQKIVATCNSTGTPSIFLHAAEAIHGDSGMITSEDIVLIISKSGESPEIKNLVQLINQFGNILIGMVGNTDSYLAKASKWILNTTVTKEACASISEVSTETAFQIYPNPSKGNVYIDFKDSFSNDFSFVICDYIGRKVLESKILQSKTLVNLEHLSSGLYTITISNDQSDIVCRKSIYKD
jgi:arabinose-5-phosphate isomerase